MNFVPQCSCGNDSCLDQISDLYFCCLCQEGEQDNEVKFDYCDPCLGKFMDYQYEDSEHQKSANM